MTGEKLSRTISAVAAALDVPQHVLRFWEARINKHDGSFGSVVLGSLMLSYSAGSSTGSA